MSEILASLALFSLALLLFLVLGSAVATAVVRVVGPSLARFAPAVRHRFLLGLTALPVVIATALMISVSLPSLVSLGVPAADHCAVHDDGHQHLCFTHLPASTSPVVASGLVLIALALLSMAVLGARRLLRGLWLVGTLEATGRRRDDITVLDGDEPLCVTAGLLRPRILISRGLLARVSPPEVEVVLAHERAHVRRRDALTSALARALCLFQLPGTAR